MSVNNGSIEFQSHNGSIQTDKPLSVHVDEGVVSIPQWFDSDLVAVENFLAFFDVSIPQWFDSDIFSHCGLFKSRMFQSHNGSIQTSSPVISIVRVYEFQSHNGSIQTLPVAQSVSA